MIGLAFGKHNQRPTLPEKTFDKIHPELLAPLAGIINFLFAFDLPARILAKGGFPPGSPYRAEWGGGTPSVRVTEESSCLWVGREGRRRKVPPPQSLPHTHSKKAKLSPQATL